MHNVPKSTAATKPVRAPSDFEDHDLKTWDIKHDELSRKLTNLKNTIKKAKVARVLRKNTQESIRILKVSPLLPYIF
jgi:hypothetical protein